MRKWLGAAALLCGLALVSPAMAASSIDKFSIIAKIEPDTDVRVSESWRYDFATSQATKLERVLFLRYQAEGRDYKVQALDFQATDDSGRPLLVLVKNEGDRLVLTLLPADQKGFSGKRIFRLSYRLEGAVRRQSQGARFNWRWSGAWPVNIEDVDARLVLSGDYQDGQVSANCEYGALNRLGKCWSKKISGANELSVEMVNGSTLYANEVMQSTVDFPATGLVFPNWSSLIKKNLRDHWPLSLPVLFLLLAAFWRGRWPQDPRRSVAFGARFYPPEDLTILELGYLMRDGFDRHDLAANIISLAVRGFLDITLTTEGGVADYILRARRQPGAMANEHEQLLSSSLFNNRQTVMLSAYLAELPQHLPAIQQAVKRVLTDKNLDNHRARLVKKLIAAWWLLFAIAAWLAARFLGLSFINQIGLSACGLLMFLFALWRPAFNRAWLELMYDIKGFERYLTSRELDSRFTANAPVRNQAMFENYLPFAMVLGLERLWAAQFDSVALLPPDWYSSPYHQVGQFNGQLLADELTTFSDIIAGQQLLR